MSENEVKKAFDAVEPGPGAQERMYANILKKAAAQTSVQVDSASRMREFSQKRRTAPVWRRWGTVAACLALVVALGALAPLDARRDEGSTPPVMGGSPFEDVAGAEDFSKLGFTIDAPEGAEDRTYCIFDGEIARVDFALDGHEYTYEAAQLEGNFSRAEGEPVDSTVLNAAHGAVLDRLPSDAWRAHWTDDSVSYYLTNFDGAEEADITAVAGELIGTD